MSKTSIEETATQLIQYFKEPLELGAQDPGAQITPESINKQVSKLIFGDPADGARVSSVIKGILDESEPDSKKVPLIALGATDAESYNTPEAWSQIERPVSKIGNVASIGSEGDPDVKLSLMFAMNSGVGIGNRNIDGLSLFFNSIPTEQMSLCQPYVSIQLQTRGMGATGQATPRFPTIFKFLEGNSQVNGDAIKMLAGTGTSRAGEPGSLQSTEGSAGMELFTSPQTLVPDSDYSSHNPDLRAVPIIDRFRPFMSLKDITINSHNAGAGTISYKEGSMSLVLHDRSRMAEIATLLNPGQFSSAEFLIEWGWSHPHGVESHIINPYGRFLNSLRKKEIFRVKNYKLTFDEVGQVNIDLDLFSPAGPSLENQKISAGPGGSNGSPIDTLEALTTNIGHALGVLQPAGYLRDITAGHVLGRMGSSTTVPNLDDPISPGSDKTVGSVLDEIISKLSEVTSDGSTERSPAHEAATELITSLNQIYGEAGQRRDENTQVRKAYNHISDVIDAKMKLLSGDETTSPDPFLLLAEQYKAQADGTNIDAVLYNRGADFVSLAKLLTIFVGQPMQDDNSQYDEVHMIFHSFNDKAGKMGILRNDARPAANIGQFLININDFKESITRMFQAQRSLEMSSSTFIKFILTNFVDDKSSVNYGLSNLYKVETNNTTGVRTVSRASTEGESQELADSIYAELNRHCKYTEFRMPTVEMLFEAMPVARQDATDANVRKEILKIHIFDRQASPMPSTLDTWNAKAHANVDATTSQEEHRGDDEAAPATGESATQQAGDQPTGSSGETGARLNEIYKAIRAGIPTITYGTSASVIKSAKVSTETDSLLATAIMLGGGPNPTPLTPTGLGDGEVPLMVFPTKVSMTMMGCPMLEYMQQLFVDFGTGTSIDNIYAAIKITHKISQGNFETSVNFAFVDAYGTYRTQAAQMQALNRVREVAEASGTSITDPS